MKEKIKAIILLILFILILIMINKMLEKQSKNTVNTTVGRNEIYSKNIENVQESKLVAEGNIVTENNEKVNSNLNENVDNDSNETSSIEQVIEVTEESFEEEVLKSDKTVLIDFYADWCNPCKILSPIVEEVAKENPNIKVVKIDVDVNEELSYEYRTYSIPTLVVIRNGKEVNRSVGVISKEEILELIK